MSKAISQMLGQDQHSLTKLISQLEEKNGNPSHDVRLLAENIQKVRVKITELGLDADDTTAQELYHALRVKFERDSSKFDEQYLSDPADTDTRLGLAARLVSKSIDMPQRWILKPATAKNLLRQNPPKHLMKKLSYRSIESMLKRESVMEIYLALSFIETHTWQKTHNKLLSQLDSTAFEMRPLQLPSLSSKKWGYFKSDSLLTYDAEAGALAILPSDETSKAPLLSIVVLLLDGLSYFMDINASQETAKINSAVAWWWDTDCAIANLSGGQVSLNVKDCAVGHLYSLGFGGHTLDSSRRSFWQELLSRYQNQLPIEEDVKSIISSSLANFKAPINQPAFEYVEDA